LLSNKRLEYRSTLKVKPRNELTVQQIIYP